MSFAAVQKHVAVPERAGLVTKERRGRKQLVRTDPDTVRRTRQAIAIPARSPGSCVAATATDLRDQGERQEPVEGRKYALGYGRRSR